MIPGLVLAGGLVAAVGAAAARMRHPFGALAVGALCGTALLAALYVLEPFTGFALPLNRFTACTAALLGAPGVAALLFLKLIWG